MNSVKAGIYGATGYTGYELATILWRHPRAEIGFATSQSYAGQSLRDNYPAGPDLALIDAQDVAEKSGMGRRINTVMQVCFFAISGVLPKEKAIDAAGKYNRCGGNGEHQQHLAR